MRTLPKRSVPVTVKDTRSTVKKLIQRGKIDQYNESIRMTAERFGISESEVMKAVQGGSFYVRTR